MDVELYSRVLWRFRYVVVPGVLLALALSFFSIARVQPGKSPLVSYRKHAEYVSYSTLFVTQPGFPWGALHPPLTANPSHFTSLAILYSQLATSDAVRGMLEKQGPIKGRIEAAPVLDSSNQQELPLISIAAFAATPDGAVALARRETSALLSYLRGQQNAHALAANDRIDVQVIKQAYKAKLYAPRKKTLAIVVFLGVLLCTFAVAFLLENVRPREKALAAELPMAAPDPA